MRVRRTCAGCVGGPPDFRGHKEYVEFDSLAPEDDPNILGLTRWKKMVGVVAEGERLRKPVGAFPRDGAPHDLLSPRYFWPSAGSKRGRRGRGRDRLGLSVATSTSVVVDVAVDVAVGRGERRGGRHVGRVRGRRTNPIDRRLVRLRLGVAVGDVSYGRGRVGRSSTTAS